MFFFFGAFLAMWIVIVEADANTRNGGFRCSQLFENTPDVVEVPRSSSVLSHHNRDL